MTRKGRGHHVPHFSEAHHNWTQPCDIRDPRFSTTTNANRHLVSASSTVKMRTYDDSFSGQKIYPGKGKLYVRGDSKIFRFQNGKSESLFLQRKNPRRIAWTVLYRRQHRKGISEEVAKKRTRRVVKHQRAIVGASLDVIKERRAQRPEAREAARKQAIKDAKEKKAAAESKKKAEKAKSAAGAAKGAGQRIQSKQGAKGSAPKVAAKSR
ncbi:60S ribosomal protein L24 [Penicillium capsulatum]|uniref:60S ribosomal protein L24 n=1 Tax=Penicillium capsulatum TaxID=69766 RepID=A0A9W9IJ57_9EURO|nr:60S ribosomal protein L24 [Penicillium capsulatum]KAJ6122146.1 60S ribosomal protein L24 [Penicillium capsulatum]